MEKARTVINTATVLEVRRKENVKLTKVDSLAMKGKVKLREKIPHTLSCISL